MKLPYFIAGHGAWMRKLQLSKFKQTIPSKPIKQDKKSDKLGLCKNQTQVKACSIIQYICLINWTKIIFLFCLPEHKIHLFIHVRIIIRNILASGLSI